MKWQYYLALVILLSIASCSKEGTPTSSDLAGTWQWVRTDGGFAFNIHDTPASTGKQIELVLTREKEYAFYTNGQLTDKGTYTLRMEQSIHLQQKRRVIEFANSGEMMVYDSIVIDSLSLVDNFPDGVGSQYVKKK